MSSMDLMDKSLLNAVSKTAVKTSKRRRSKRLSLMDTLQTAKKIKSPSPRKQIKEVPETEVAPNENGLGSEPETPNVIEPQSQNTMELQELLELPESSMSPCIREGIKEYNLLKQEQTEWISLTQKFYNKKKQLELELKNKKEDSGPKISFEIPEYIKELNKQIDQQENKLDAVVTNRKNLYTKLNNATENFAAIVNSKIASETKDLLENRMDPKIIITQLLDLP